MCVLFGLAIGLAVRTLMAMIKAKQVEKDEQQQPLLG
jgi:hypothetical protein